MFPFKINTIKFRKIRDMRVDFYTYLTLVESVSASPSPIFLFLPEAF